LAIEQNPPRRHNGNIDEIVRILPTFYYAVNKVLEDCTSPDLSKKSGVVLWLLASAHRQDQKGDYLTNADLVQRFQEWNVVKPENASSEVTKAKKELFNLDYIEVSGAPDHIRLNENGKRRAHKMYDAARSIVQETIAVLSARELALLLELANRMISGRKPPESVRHAGDIQTNLALEE
jgi:hypothetical protein